MVLQGFIGPTYTLQNTAVDCQRCVNLYPQVDESGAGKNVASLLATPGLTYFANIGVGPVRGFIATAQGRVFGVCGVNLIELMADGSQVTRGQLISSTGPVSIAENGQQMMLVDGLNGYGYTLIGVIGMLGAVNVTSGQGGTNYLVGDQVSVVQGTANQGLLTVTSVDSNGAVTGLSFASVASGYVVGGGNATTGGTGSGLEIDITAVTDLDANVLTVLTTTDSDTGEDAGVTGPFPGGGTVTFQDGYFIFNVPGTQQFYISGLYATTVDPLDFASKEGSPDNILCVISDHRELWLFGAKTIEVWFNSGAPLFPFQYIQGAFITHGTAAAQSPCALDNTLYWLGQDAQGNAMVWKANGYQPARVSTHAMEQAIQKYSTVADAVGFAYQQNGHAFYVLNFPSGNATWVYDAATGLWHERAYLSNGTLGRARPVCHAVGFGLHLVGDYANGNLYSYDLGNFTDNGNTLVRMRRAPYVDAEARNLFFARLTMEMQVGVGLDGNAAEPRIGMRYSDDQGQTWSNQRLKGMGRIGAGLARVFWSRLGRSRQRVFEVVVTDPVPVALINAYIDFEVGSS